jgi:hypothetical protein
LRRGLSGWVAEGEGLVRVREVRLLMESTSCQRIVKASIVRVDGFGFLGLDRRRACY